MRNIYLTVQLLLFTIVAAFAQPKLITKIPVNSTNFTKAGNLLYFTSGDTLYKSDGSAPGTSIVKTGLKNPGELREFNGTLFFLNNRQTSPYLGAWKELYRSDGTPAGTIQLFKSSDFNISVTAATSQYLYFIGSTPSTGIELYRTDGTIPNTILLKDINPGTGQGATFRTATRGNDVFFFANNPATGFELWKTNGTSAGTSIVKDLAPGAADGVDNFHFGAGLNLIAYDNQIYFEGTDGTNGFQLYKTDGSGSGTLLVKEFERQAGDGGIQGPGGVEFYKIFNGKLYFSYHPAWTSRTAIIDLYQTNGTDAGTVFLKRHGDLFDENNSLYSFRELNNQLFYFFSSNNFTSSLFSTNGTPAGTTLVHEGVSIDGNVVFAEVFNNWLVYYPENQGTYFKGYKTQGTGHQDFITFNDPYDSPHTVKAGNYLLYIDFTYPYFSNYTSESTYQLFQSDINSQVRVKDLYGISLSGTSNLVVSGNKVYFKTYNPSSENPADHFAKLWEYNPNATNTPQISFSLIDAAANTIKGPLNYGDSIFYTAGKDQINITASPLPGAASVVFRLDGKVVRTENSAPFSLAGDNAGDYNSWNATYGPHILTATAYSGKDGAGTITGEQSIVFSIVTPISDELITFTLVNAETDQDIAQLNPGDYLYLKDLGTNKLNIRAVSSRSETKSIVFNLGGISNFRTENSAPYSVFGDNNGDYAVHYFTEGSYLIKATSYSEVNGKGIEGNPSTVYFYISDDNFESVKTKPNPVADRVTVILPDVTAQSANVEVYDYSGKEYYRKTHAINAGEFDMNFDQSDLQAGIYFVRISTGDDVKVVSIVKE